jgi:membrane-bound metal-dependent hydrolase YbcI (DUF457 family)
MLPPGHIAAGYLTGYALLKFAKPALDSQQQTQLLWWSAFFGFAPDIDVFFVFFSTHSLLVAGDKDVNHRKYFSHAPVLWLLAGLLIYFFAPSTYLKYIGLLLWLASWSHFLLDSIEHGVMWLWPFSKKVFAIKNQGERTLIPEKNFFKHSLQFLKFYTTRVSFYLEVLIIAAALIIYFK